MNQTQEVLSEMLKENTGRALCDSGGDPKFDDKGNFIGAEYGFGRHYDVNHGIDFEKTQATDLRFDVFRGEFSYIDITHNIYHWLGERLDYDKEANEAFDELADANPGDIWHVLREKFPEWYVNRLNEQGDVEYEAGGIYGEDDPITVNTCNHENLLSQTILYKYFELRKVGERHSSFDGDKYVVLQIHGGADVRGGYTKPRIFRVNENIGELPMMDDHRAGMYCTGENHHPTAPKPEPVDKDKMPEWYDHRWFNDGGDMSKPSGWSSDDYDKVQNLDYYEVKVLTDKDNQWEQGKLCMDEDCTGYCPECGAQLAASSY
jgi:hypothetical protein